LVQHFDHVAAYIPARNEEKYIGKTLEYLVKLDVPILDVVVVDDGSRDGTRDVLDSQVLPPRRSLTVLSLPDAGVSKLGRPSLAAVHNVALRRARRITPEAVLIVGADHLLPRTYLRQLSQRMTENTAIASGSIKNEHLVSENPSGSGRLVPAWFLDEVDWRYPVIWGWESAWIYQAWRRGYETRCYQDVVTEGQRPNRAHRRDLSNRVSRYYGYGMRQLGYYWPNAVNRARIFGRKRFASMIHMLAGYLSTEVPHYETADYLATLQKENPSPRIHASSA
jgi:cellulose synthase/poly-beta-1,6-N-acetylglucosamine synthase-like glycosyltransferase